MFSIAPLTCLVCKRTAMRVEHSQIRRTTSDTRDSTSILCTTSTIMTALAPATKLSGRSHIRSPKRSPTTTRYTGTSTRNKLRPDARAACGGGTTMAGGQNERMSKSSFTFQTRRVSWYKNNH
eukprot:936494-Prorocentrum_minimum.AAC.1